MSGEADRLIRDLGTEFDALRGIEGTKGSVTKTSDLTQTELDSWQQDLDLASKREKQIASLTVKSMHAMHRLGGCVDHTRNRLKVDQILPEDALWTYGDTKDAINAAILGQTLDRTSLAAGGNDTWTTEAGSGDAIYTTHTLAAPDQAAVISLDAVTTHLVQWRGGYVRSNGNTAVVLTLVDPTHSVTTSAPTAVHHGHYERFVEVTPNNNNNLFSEYLGAGGDNDAIMQKWFPLYDGDGWHITIATPAQSKYYKFGAKWRWLQL